MTEPDDQSPFLPAFPAFDLYSANEILHILARTFESVPFPVAIMGADRVIDYANQKMSLLLSNNNIFCFENKALRMQNMRSEDSFGSLMKEIAIIQGFSDEIKSFSIFSSSDEELYKANVRRLSGYMAGADDIAETKIVLSLEEKIRPTGLNSALLEDLFSLSSREAEIANRILVGDDSDTIARDLEVSVSTVRSRIKAVLRKTGCRGQRELSEVLGQLRNAQ